MTRQKRNRALSLAVLALGFCGAAPGWAAVTWSGNSLQGSVGSSAYVGYTSAGTLTINGGSSLSRYRGFIGYTTGSTGIATISDANSKWINTDYLYVGHDGTGTLNILANGEVSDTRGYLGYNAGSSGTATVTGTGSKWTNSGDVYVGDSGSGTLSIEAGGQVSDSWGYVGAKAGSTGVVAVRGTDSKWTNSGYLWIGSSGSGALSIEAGGLVSNTHGYLGSGTGSSGTATVTGAGSTWSNSGNLRVGSYGEGKLTVADGGLVTAKALWASLSDLSGDGTITASGAVTDADLLFDNPLAVTQTVAFGSGGKLNVTPDGTGSLGLGYKGNGSLRIANGAVVASTSGYLGYGSGFTGTATVSGAGSTWANNDFYVGFEGSGRLTVADGGLVTAQTLYASPNDLYGNGTVTATTGAVIDADLAFDKSHGTSQTLTFGDGGTLNLSFNGGTLGVGHRGSGSLRITDGVAISASYGQLGYGVGSSGTATVSGPGSKWATSNYLYVGNSGSGVLNIEAGGQVDSIRGYIAYAEGSTGTVDLNGAGSMWTGNDSIYVGYSGSGTLTIRDGASAGNSGTAYVASKAGSVGVVTVSGEGSQWLVGSGVYVGGSGSGVMSIEAGGRVSSVDGNIGNISGSTGMVTVCGVGSAWTNTGNVFVGNAGNGMLSVECGANVSSWRAFVGYRTGSSGAAMVSGEGSVWSSDYLDVGHGGSGALNVSGGGRVISGYSYVGGQTGSTGAVTVSGRGSTWSSSEYLAVHAGGKLTVADDGKVVAKRLFVHNGTATVDLHVSGDDMLVVGDEATIGSVANDGAINLFADPLLPEGVYRPISEYAGRSMAWSGTGSYNGFGGTWDSTAKTFTVLAPMALSAGASDTVTTGERLLFTDTFTGQRVGASFGSITGSVSFSAAPVGAADLAGLAGVLEEGRGVLSAWGFTTNFSGGEAMLSFDIGTGAEKLAIWRYSGGVWSAFTPSLFTYDANGLASFTVSSFSGYAVTAAVPEPGALTLLGLAGSMLLARRRARA